MGALLSLQSPLSETQAGSFITNKRSPSQKEEKRWASCSPSLPSQPPPHPGRRALLRSLLYKCPVKLFILTVHFLGFPSSVNCPQFRNLWRDESQIAETHQCLSWVTFQGIPITERGRSFSSEAKALLLQVQAWFLLLHQLPLNWGLWFVGDSWFLLIGSSPKTCMKLQLMMWNSCAGWMVFWSCVSASQYPILTPFQMVPHASSEYYSHSTSPSQQCSLLCSAISLLTRNAKVCKYKYLRKVFKGRYLQGTMSEAPFCQGK